MQYSSYIWRNAVTVVLALALFPSLGAARTTDLVEPSTVTINCSLPSAQMQQVIRRGGEVRHWRGVDDERPGTMELRYIKGDNKHIITVNIRYTSNTFAVTYKDSVNLAYFVNYEGVRRLHPRAVGWMKNLSGDIAEVANGACAR